nr:hypothetical protein [uncultured Cohaesibacter sp.]
MTEPVSPTANGKKHHFAIGRKHSDTLDIKAHLVIGLVLLAGSVSLAISVGVISILLGIIWDILLNKMSPT